MLIDTIGPQRQTLYYLNYYLNANFSPFENNWPACIKGILIGIHYTGD